MRTNGLFVRRGLALGVAVLLLGSGAALASEGGHAGWQRGANNEVANLPSLQRGARNFMAYCSGCHSLQYMRYSRLAEDLKIPDEQRDAYIVPRNAKFSDYIKTSMPAQDAAEWFGKAPPDLSLIARSRGTDYVFNFLTTFYADPASRQTGVNNLQLPGTAMPHVLAGLQGVQAAVWKNVESKDKGADGNPLVLKEFEAFGPGIAGSLTPAQYDEFVRDTVNFLDYVGDPSQLERKSLGIWVVLFLLMFTGIAYMLKSEYWKDVR
ncbi:MAG: cytochrome c1 [Steroidobacteraceae bacterium]|nr:cytochrome c1 [Steroidobacteraceae bacterium]